MQDIPTILVTNDDGVSAKGIRNLVEVASEFGHVVVVAPDGPQSAQSHSITIKDPIRIKKAKYLHGSKEAYACSGTPVDCVKLARHVVMKDQKIDLCLSGINHGSNASSNVLYSGTMAAASEASLLGINAIGFSLNDFSADADFSASTHFVRKIIRHVLTHGMGESNLFNVNIPNIPTAEIRGVKVCRQAKGYWTEKFIEHKDPTGKPYYWLTGAFHCPDTKDDTDIWALDNHYVSLVPILNDRTEHNSIESLSSFEKII